MKLIVRILLIGLIGMLLGVLGEWQPWFRVESAPADGGNASDLNTPDPVARKSYHPGIDANLLPTATPPRDNVFALLDSGMERCLAAPPADPAALVAEGRTLAAALLTLAPEPGPRTTS